MALGSLVASGCATSRSTTDWRELYVAILADFLMQAVQLPSGR